MRLPWSFSVFDYPELCRLLWEQSARPSSRPRRSSASRRSPGARDTVDPDHVFEIETDRGVVSAPLVVDCLGWRRVLGGGGYQPPDGPLSRGLEVHPGGANDRNGALDRARHRAGRLRLELPGRRRAAGRASAPSTRASTSRSRLSSSPSGSTCRPTATRATGSPTGCARPPRAASSSAATRPATACRSPPRGSAPPSTSRSPRAARSAPWSTAAAIATGRCATTPTSTPPPLALRMDAARAEDVPRVPPKVLAPALRGISTTPSCAGRSTST